MSEQTSDQSTPEPTGDLIPADPTTADSAEASPPGDARHVTLTRDSVGRYTVRNDRGGSITTSSGTEELSPVELLLAGIAACTAVDVDTVTTRRAEPDSFLIDVTADKVKALKVGPGTEPGVNIGPLIDQNAVTKVEEHVADAAEHGAKVVIGGKPSPLGGNFYEPTVLTGVTPKM